MKNYIHIAQKTSNNTMENKIKIFVNKNTWWYKQLQSEIDDVMAGDCQDNITLPNDITYNYTIE